MGELPEELRKFLESEGRSVEIYESSIVKRDGGLYFMIREGGVRKLVIIRDRAPYEGVSYDVEETGVLELGNSHYHYRICPRTGNNANLLQSEFPWLSPRPLGNRPAVGMGDRTGVCAPGQVKVAKKCKAHAVLAQQSIREMEHVEREPRDVLEDTIWAVFQEGYRKRWAADADHLKSKEDIDRCFEAGFSMYTLDPSEHIDEKAESYDSDNLREKFGTLPWGELEINPEEYIQKYRGDINLPALDSKIDEEDVLRTAVKYGRALVQVKELCEYLEQLHGGRDFDLEVSADEIEDPTTPTEHFIIASELRRLGIRVDSFAPKFPGAFEKGINYRGDIDEFEEYYDKHMVIAETFGYKLSVHSGSDKFSVYPILGKKDEYVHLKTSGTSYLEALRVIARKDSELFREIIDYARKCFEEERKDYGNLVSAEMSEVPGPGELEDDELEEVYLDEDMGRQILHVTYGPVLAAKDKSDKYIFRDRLHEILIENEENYNHIILSHFEDHLEPFGWIEG